MTPPLTRELVEGDEQPLRLLYVNGSFGGGSLMSTERLLVRVAGLNARPTLLRSTEGGARARAVYKRLTNLEVRESGSVDAGPLAALSRSVGRRRSAVADAVFPTWTAAVVENAAIGPITNGDFDVVVVSSVLRPAWMRLRRLTSSTGVPCVLYLREEALLAHLPLAEPPDLLLANSRALCDAASSMSQRPVFIPSVVELDQTVVDSTCERVLLINPTDAYGVDTALSLAERCPGINFVLQESSLLGERRMHELEDRTRSLRNVEIRPFTTDAASVFRDARVLLTPYTSFLHSNRPRAVLEAQRNSIPVLAADRPGLREAVGNGGRFVPAEASLSEWAAALEDILDEPDYSRLSDAARRHATRPEVQPSVIAERFLAELRALVRG